MTLFLNMIKYVQYTTYVVYSYLTPWLYYRKEVIQLKVQDIEVGDRIGESPKFRIYLGTMNDGRLVILKVAKTFEDGDVLAEEAGKFNILRAFEEQVAELASLSENNPHYDWLFANLLSSFMEPTQGDRRINVLATPDINLSELIPLTKLRAETEIDTRTSIWILGRFLKFYGFFELLAASGDNPVARYPVFSPDDYLIGPNKHRLIYYNFSGDMADVIANDFVKTIAKFILDWAVVGADSAEQEYFELLRDFSKHGRISFEEAHGDLYKLVGRLWGIQYHPFTYRDHDTTIWKTIKED